MRFFLFAFFFMLVFASCGKKRKVIAQGEIMDEGSRVHWEMYSDNGKFFKSFTENGKILALQTAASQQDFTDSTFTETDYWPGGRTAQTKAFYDGKPDGEWISYNEKGQKLSYSVSVKGLLLRYNQWYDDGRSKVEAQRHPDGRMVRTEFYVNGDTSQHFNTDSVGNGRCSTFYINGMRRETGNLYHFLPSGIWERYDSLGHRRKDTLYGVLQ